MRLTIKLKLALAFGLIILLAGATAAIGLMNLSKLNSTMDATMAGPVEKLQIAEELQSTFLFILRAEKNMVISEDAADVARYDGQIPELRKTLQALLDRGFSLSTAAGRPKWEGFRDAWERYIGVSDKIREYAKSNDDAKARELMMGEGRQLIEAVAKNVDDLVSLSKTQMADAGREADEAYDAARSLMFATVLAAFVIATGTAIWISLSISQGLGRAGALAEAVALGDLDQNIEIKSNDEIKDLVLALNRMTKNLRSIAGIADTIANGDLTVQAKPLSEKDALGLALVKMLDRLRMVVSEVTTASENVSAGSQELSSSAEELSQGATEQASSVEEACSVAPCESSSALEDSS